MARTGPRALVGFAILFTFPIATPAGPNDDRANAIATTLAVQTALQHGRECLLQKNPQAAVYVLEKELARINGNREYLAVLRDAYRAYVKELRLANKDAEAEVYLRRLQILDPGAVLDSQPAASPRPAVKEQTQPPPPAPSKADDPFHEDHSKRKEVSSLLEQAEQAFAAGSYAAAGRLFEQAYQADPQTLSECRERWAYCKLNGVVEELNRPDTSSSALAGLEQEVRQALSLAPRLDEFGKKVLGKLEERRKSTAGPATEKRAEAAIRHLPRNEQGWAVVESANFRIHHNQPHDFAEKVVQTAERARDEVHRKWFGEPDRDWNPKCDVYLHATSQDYSQATKQAANSPGHSTIRSQGKQVVGRRIDLRCDEPNLLPIYLPHETTHVVLAGKFDGHALPRWADEGMAVLTEPRHRVELYGRTLLARCHQNGQLFGIRQLMQMDDYPAARSIDGFYAQSVSLVEFLVSRKGPLAFTQFLRDGLNGGIEPALKKHYGLQGYNELEQAWVQYALRGANPAEFAQRGR
jgi:hypothetical protein